MPQWSDTVEQLRVLESRRRFLEVAAERYGDATGHKAREAAALGWLLDVLAETLELADDVAEARRLVARRPPQIR